ncbi:MAG: hypothetical protein ACLU9S_24060 [Oscillospiraceae bacterium]
MSAGILFMTSAGNAGYSSVNNNYEGNTLTSDPEISMVSTPPPSTSSNLCVASMENTVQAQSVLSWTGTDGQAHKIAYQDPTDIAMKYKFAGRDAVAGNPRRLVTAPL